MNKHDKDKLAVNIKQTLDDSVDSLDAQTLSRIRQVRSRAIEQTEDRSLNWFGLMSGALATACVMVFAIMILLNSPDTSQMTPIDDLDLISSSDNLELYEDLEFYEWLEDEALFG